VGAGSSDLRDQDVPPGAERLTLDGALFGDPPEPSVREWLLLHGIRWPGGGVSASGVWDLEALLRQPDEGVPLEPLASILGRDHLTGEHGAVKLVGGAVLIYGALRSEYKRAVRRGREAQRTLTLRHDWREVDDDFRLAMRRMRQHLKGSRFRTPFPYYWEGSPYHASPGTTVWGERAEVFRLYHLSLDNELELRLRGEPLLQVLVGSPRGSPQVEEVVEEPEVYAGEVVEEREALAPLRPMPRRPRPVRWWGREVKLDLDFTVRLHPRTRLSELVRLPLPVDRLESELGFNFDLLGGEHGIRLFRMNFEGSVEVQDRIEDVDGVLFIGIVRKL
jgi:hypothetical protein